jgi:hypothetical protein
VGSSRRALPRHAAALPGVTNRPQHTHAKSRWRMNDTLVVPAVCGVRGCKELVADAKFDDSTGRWKCKCNLVGQDVAGLRGSWHVAWWDAPSSTWSWSTRGFAHTHLPSLHSGTGQLALGISDMGPQGTVSNAEAPERLACNSPLPEPTGPHPLANNERPALDGHTSPAHNTTASRIRLNAEKVRQMGHYLELFDIKSLCLPAALPCVTNRLQRMPRVGGGWKAHRWCPLCAASVQTQSLTARLAVGHVRSVRQDKLLLAGIPTESL